MNLSFIDYVAFAAFLIMVISVTLYASRQKKQSPEEYFLAGRSLPWWAIGFSLIASNISTEHFVGMAGRGYALGLAIASYEWMAAITLIIVALFFLPRFLALGIYTIPQYLEHRYGKTPRIVMSILMMLAYIFVALSSILYSGALALKTIFGINLVLGVWLIGILAGCYTIYGGLKAVVWSDLLQGIALLLGGILITILGFKAIGGVQTFFMLAKDQLHTVLPWNHSEMPWPAVFIGGLWIPNLFYWGLNQFITQRTLGARSIKDGQKGIILAAFLKLLIPFIIVFPGIMALHLYGDSIPRADMAYPYLITKILPVGLRGLMLAALFGAVMSSLDSALNSASTIFTIDLYKGLFRPKASHQTLVRVGKRSTAALVLFGCLWAPLLESYGSIFQYIQMVWGFISPGIVATFLFGIFLPRTPSIAATMSMILGIPIYGSLLWFFPDMAFLHHMFITFMCLSAIILYLTYRVKLPVLQRVQMSKEFFKVYQGASSGIKYMGGLLVILTATLYMVFY